MSPSRKSTGTISEMLSAVLKMNDQALLCGQLFQGFPSGSDGKESACDAGDLGSIPG